MKLIKSIIAQKYKILTADLWQGQFEKSEHHIYESL